MLLLAEQRLALSQHAEEQPTSGLALDWATLQAAAVREQACLLVYSQLTASVLLIWVIGSADGALLPFKQVSLKGSRRSIAEMVELTRRFMGARSRSAAPPAHATTRDIEQADGKLRFDASMVAKEVAMVVGDERHGGASRLTDGAVDPTSEEVKRALDTLLCECYELLIAPVSDALASETDLLIIPGRTITAPSLYHDSTICPTNCTRWRPLCAAVRCTQERRGQAFN